MILKRAQAVAFVEALLVARLSGGQIRCLSFPGHRVVGYNHHGQIVARQLAADDSTQIAVEHYRTLADFEGAYRSSPE